jgi:hypothetical protein
MQIARKFRFWAKVAAINLAVFLVGLCAVELIFGAWVRAPGLWTLSIQRDFSMYTWKVEKYLRDRPMKYSRDYYGFRGNAHPIKALNIIALGGSTTDERDVSDEETWTARLEACLNDKGIAAKIGNAGINGQSTLGHIKNFSVWFDYVPSLHPKYFLVYAGINESKILDPIQNDFNDDVTFVDRDGQPNRRYGIDTIERFTRGKVLLDWIEANSALYSLYRIVVGNILAIGIGSNPRWQTELYYDAPPKGVLWSLEKSSFRELERALIVKELADQASSSMDKLESAGKTGAMRVDDYFASGVPTVSLSDEVLLKLKREEDAQSAAQLNAYRERIGVLVRSIRVFGAQPILITQPKGSHRLKNGTISGDIQSFVRLDAFNRVLMEACRDSRATCIDLAQNIEIADGDYWDWEHTTPEGSAKIGAKLCRMLTASRVLTPATFATDP